MLFYISYVMTDSSVVPLPEIKATYSSAATLSFGLIYVVETSICIDPSSE